MADQLAFRTLLDEAEERQRQALDRHREQVQTWFDELAGNHKEQLATWMSSLEWDTCVALSTAAGDWQRAQVTKGH